MVECIQRIRVKCATSANLTLVPVATGSVDWLLTSDLVTVCVVDGHIPCSCAQNRECREEDAHKEKHADDEG